MISLSHETAIVLAVFTVLAGATFLALCSLALGARRERAWRAEQRRAAVLSGRHPSTAVAEAEAIVRQAASR